MRVIIAGSRSFEDYPKLRRVVNSFHKQFTITQVVSGNARGADSLGEWWAAENNITIRVFPANWSQYGRAAGHIRNEEMAKNADALIAFWDGKSPGTKSMIEKALKKGLETVVEYIK